MGQQVAKKAATGICYRHLLQACDRSLQLLRPLLADSVPWASALPARAAGDAGPSTKEQMLRCVTGIRLAQGLGHLGLKYLSAFDMLFSGSLAEPLMTVQHVTLQLPLSLTTIRDHP